MFGKKSKVFIAIIATLLVLGGLLYWRYDSVKESLILANKEIEDIAQELRMSEESIEQLERDIQLQTELLVQKEEQRLESQKRASSLSAQLEKEKSNEDLQACLPLDLSGYVERVREFPAYQDSDRDKSNHPE